MKLMYIYTKCLCRSIIAGLMIIVIMIMTITVSPAFYNYAWGKDGILKESDMRIDEKDTADSTDTADALDTAANGPDIDTPSAILMESKTGQIIYEKDATKQLAPASITKIMTLILIFEALESGQIKKTR